MKTEEEISAAIYTYDDHGNLKTHAYNGYNFTYNTLGSILTANIGLQELVEYTYSPDTLQNVTKAEYNNGQTLNYVYDEVSGELKEVKQGETVKYSYVYSPEEQTETDDGETSTNTEADENTDPLTKDLEGEWVKITDKVSGLFKVINGDKISNYDLANNPIYSVENFYEDEETEGSFNGKKITVGTNVYTLKSEENKDTFLIGGTENFVKTYENDYAGNLWKVNTGGAVSTTYGYNENNNISSLINNLNGLKLTYEYGYDGNGNITAENLTIAPETEDGSSDDGTNQAVSYEYDEKNQLTKATNSTTEWSYEYDSRGNIISKSIRDIDTDDTLTYTYGYDSVWKDRLVSYNSEIISYEKRDENEILAVSDPSNPLIYRGNELTWTMGRQLASFGNITYSYNEEGIRTKKVNGEVVTEYYLDGNKIIEQNDGTNIIHFLYDSRGEITGFVYNENAYHYVKNVQSDITAILNSSGEIISEYKYDPYGKIISISGDTVIGQLNPFRYRSYYYDTDTELYYLQTRYYDPEVGRFINCDDFSYIESQEEGLAWNVFSYCENNPVNGNDKDGHGLLDILSLFKKVVPVVKVINSLYELITIKYDDLNLEDEYGKVKDKDRTNSTKGIISISFTRKTDLWYQGFKQGRSFVDEITRIALEKFRSEVPVSAKTGKSNENKVFNRCFLLSESCVSNEIYLHLQGYLWAKEYKGVLPVAMFIGHYYLNKKEKDNHYKKEHEKTGTSLQKLYIADASKDADMYEADAAFRKYAEGNFFYYFEGIADCYKGTKYDPFCANTKIDLRLRYYTREGWLNEKLKCSCK